MNYILSFAIIVMGTVFSALCDSPNYKWLLISDLNVAIALFFAWVFDKGKLSRPINIIINHHK